VQVEIGAGLVACFGVELFERRHRWPVYADRRQVVNTIYGIPVNERDPPARDFSIWS
jgi:hypothetical protein